LRESKKNKCQDDTHTNYYRGFLSPLIPFMAVSKMPHNAGHLQEDLEINTENSPLPL